jgi:predicted nucleic acid-binding protein
VRALLDTSFFVAAETDRPRGEARGVDQTEVSVMTIAELTVGVLLSSEEDRPRRLATLSAVESNWDPLPVSADVARAFAGIVADLRSRRRRIPVLDALVAATAVVEGIPVVTQDRDYQEIPGVEVIAI